MMRRVDKKRKYSPASNSAKPPVTKKRKTDSVDDVMTLTPHHIRLGNGYVRYYFDDKSKAEIYWGKINSSSYDIKITEIKGDDADDPTYHRVSLTPELFDSEFGEGAYKNLFEINEILHATVPNLLNVVPSQWSAAFANQVVLLDDDGVGFLWFAARYFSVEQFLFFVSQLSPETCNQVAIPESNNQVEHPIGRMAHYQSLEALMIFFDRLNPEIRTKSMLFQLGALNGSCALEIIAERNGDHPAWLKVLCALYQYPEEIKKIVKQIPHLKRLALYDGGTSDDVWSIIASAIIQLAPNVKKRKAEYDLPAAMASVKAPRLEKKPNYLNELVDQGWQFLRVQGRTIIFQDKNGNNLLAVKIQKHNEPESELSKEYNTTRYFKRHAKELNLKSDLPTPVKFTQISEVLEWLVSRLTASALADFKKMVDNFDVYSAYVYKINVKNCDYLTYLHDIRLSDEAFMTANEKAVHDLFTLFARGVIFPQLADIFHNSEHVSDREDKGRYMVLVNLLRSLGAGSGRLTGWKEAVEYPNVRGSGLADLGDRVSLRDFIGDGDRVKEFYEETRRLYSEKAGNYLLANVMAEYQYVLLLIAGRRGCDLSEQVKKHAPSPQEGGAEIRFLWYKLAQQIVSNCALAVSILTYQRKDEVEVFLSSIVDVERLGRQMQYWMTDEYIPDVNKNQIPEDIYGKTVPVSVIRQYFREDTFNDKVGFSIDGVHADLGPVNGQEPIKEANKLFYWMVTSVFNSYHQVQFTLRDVRAITNEGDLEKSEALRKKSFSHLPEKSYHAIQSVLCRERLAQSEPLPSQVRIELKKEAEQHERSQAALTILGFWRKHKVGTQKQRTSHLDAGLLEYGEQRVVKRR